MDLAELWRSTVLPAKRHRRLQLAREATRRKNRGTPLTGAWYWLPTKAAATVTWTIEEFFDIWLPGSDHVYIWRHVREALEYSWKRTLTNIDYCSLPRGRVSQMRLPTGSPVTFAICHGNDSPLGEPGLARVRKCFQLPADCRVTFDEHERCIAGQPEALSRALGHDLKVHGVEASELDWGDE